MALSLQCQSKKTVSRCLSCLTDDDLALLGEVVLGDLEVERRRALADAARDVVVRTVAGAEPTAEFTSLADGDTTKVGADT